MSTITVKENNLDIITPTKDSLTDVETKNNICPVTGCGQKFRNSSALRFHVNKRHGDKSFMATANSGRARKFACPVKGCSRHITSERQWFFASMFQLKKHYQSIHAEKKYKCQKCEKKFGCRYNFAIHEDRCQRLFYCSCGAYYTTQQAVQTHAFRRGTDHNVIGEKNDSTPASKKKIINNVIIPAVLYIPKSTLSTSLSSTVNTNDVRTSNSHIVKRTKEKLILPKPDPKQLELTMCQRNDNSFDKMFQNFSNEITVRTCNLGQSTAECDNNAKNIENEQDMVSKIETDLADQTVVADKPKTVTKEKLTAFERKMLYLASEEAQNVLADPMLICDTIIRKTVQAEVKKKKCRCKKHMCKHIDKKLMSLSKYYNLIQNTPETNTADISCGSALLTNNSAGSFSPFEQAEDPPNPIVHSDIDTQTNQIIHYDGLPNIDVLETSDFSMQCQLPSGSELMTNSCVEADTQTQTEHCMNSWLNTLSYLGATNHIETQTSYHTRNNLTQTEVVQTNNSPMLLDKSIQLDDLWDNNTIGSDSFFLSDSTNIGTQTAIDENWLFRSLSTDLLNDQNSMSTQTTCDLLDIDFNIEKKDQSSQYISTSSTTSQGETKSLQDALGKSHNNADLDKSNVYSSSTQTFGYLTDFFDGNSGATKSSCETQTLISFYDLLDTSFIDDYLNEEKKTSSIETQTHSCSEQSPGHSN